VLTEAQWLKMAGGGKAGGTKKPAKKAAVKKVAKKVARPAAKKAAAKTKVAVKKPVASRKTARAASKKAAANKKVTVKNAAKKAAVKKIAGKKPPKKAANKAARVGTAASKPPAERLAVHISDLNDNQKAAFCDKMAMCGCDELMSSAYSHCWSFFNLEEPENPDFSYTDGSGEILFERAREVMHGVMYVQLLHCALYRPEAFDDFAGENRGYAHAISMLAELREVGSDDEFQEFVDSIEWG
jgi:hypothetical protein